MKLDMHCHTKEGSIDARVGILTYVHHLSSLGFDGMLVTDHNSYKGYEAWKKQGDSLKLPRPFTVLKGIEYDTSDAGHFIVIMPDDIYLRLLEIRGLPLRKLERIVHYFGGILGPAHPYGNGPLSMMRKKSCRKKWSLLQKCDFIESYNGCEPPLSNKLAYKLAKHMNKPQIAGSDAHRMCVIGTAFTQFEQPVTCNNDLIRLIQQNAPMKVPHYSSQNKHKHWNHTLQVIFNFCYRLYHRILSVAVLPVRRKELRQFRHITL